MKSNTLWGITIIIGLILAACAGPAPTATPRPTSTLGPTPVPATTATLAPPTAAPTPVPAPTATRTPLPTPTATARPTPTPSPTPPPPTATPTPRPPEQALEMRNFAFAPASATVKVGTVLVWTNRDSVPHTVTANATPPDPVTFDSGFLAPGQTFRFTAAQEGGYPYHCSIHPAMTGEIAVVKELAPTPTVPPGATRTPTPTSPTSGGEYSY